PVPHFATPRCPVALPVSLAVEEGEIHAVIGPNGAGKTTLFNLLSGFLKPSSGEVRLFGERVDTLSPQLLVRRGLARSFQISSVFSSMTVRENLAVALQAATPCPPVLGQRTGTGAV
ncbi:MAG: ATP-binding cassette domain-containing protein, partial [Deinococcus sp.]